MTEPVAPPAAENERSRRTARLEELVRRFGDPFHVTQFAKTHAAKQIKDKYDALLAGERTGDSVAVAGRIMAIRNNGMFIVILDDTDRLQIFHDLKQLPSFTASQISPLRPFWYCSLTARASPEVLGEGDDQPSAHSGDRIWNVALGS